MMAQYIGEVRFKTSIDASGMNKGLAETNRKLKTLGGNAAGSAAKSLGAVSGALGKVIALAGISISVAGLVNLSKASVKAASNLQSAEDSLRFLANANNRSFPEMKRFVQDFTSDGLVPMTAAYETYRNMLSRGYSTEQLQSMMNVMKDSAVYARQASYTIGEAMVKSSEGLRMENSLLTDSVGIQKNVAKMWDEYAKSIGTTANRLTHAQKLQAEFNGFMAEGGVFAGAAAQYANSYAGKVAKLTAMFENLKVAIGNSIIPVINQILPYITVAIQWFTRLFNIVDRVMNLLFGTSVSMADIGQGAQEAGSGAEEFADGMERGAQAAKGALASFDKIEVLNRPVEGGDGGGLELPDMPPIALPDTKSFVEELDELEERLRAFVDRLKGMFTAGDYEGIGRLVGEALSSGVIWGLGKIQAFFSKFDWSALGQGIGGFVNGIDWVGILANLGKTLSLLVSGAFDLVLGFVKTVDWQKLGSDVINGIYSFVTSIDWGTIVPKAFELLAAWLGANINFFIGIATAFWDNLKLALKTTWDYFAGYIDESGGNIAQGLLEGILNALVDIATWVYDHIVKPFMTALLDAFGLDWGEVEEWFTEAWDKVSKWAIEAWEDIKEAWQNAATWFDEKVIQPLKAFFDPIVAWFEDDIVNPLKEKWGKLVDKFKELVGVIKDKVIDPLVSFFETVLWPRIKTVLEWLKNLFSTVWNVIKTIVLTAVGAIWGGLQVAWGWIKAGFETAFNIIKTIFMTVVQVIATIVGTIIDVFAGIIDFVIGVFTGDWKRAWDGIKDIFTGIWEGIRDTVKSIINGIIGFINGMIKGIVSGINAVIGVLNKLPDLPGLGGQSFGFNIAPISAPQIPLLATGAVIPPNAPFAAILGDQRGGFNVEAPEKLIRDLLRDELSKASFGSENITVKFEGSLSPLIRELNPVIVREQRRKGNSLIVGKGGVR